MKHVEIHPNDEDLRFLRMDQILDLIPVGRSSIYRMIEAGVFPAPCKIGKISVWPNTAVREWRDRMLPARSSNARPASKPSTKPQRDHSGLI